MASNSFGQIFKITTFGESHGKSIGVVIDGCPAGLEISEEEINLALQARAPGRNSYLSPRKESDLAQIISGVFEGRTTGAPLTILIPNLDADSSKYDPVKHLLKPGHAHYTYLEKYGTFDHRGGGRASARETACRVAAGAVAKKILSIHDVHVLAYLKQMGDVTSDVEEKDLEAVKEAAVASPLFCANASAEKKMVALLEEIKKEGDSIGGVVEFAVFGKTLGLGDPVYEKLEARLAYALMGLPASKGFEIGSGFLSAQMKGSEHNDLFMQEGEKIQTSTNFSGGTLGGIANGMPIVGRVVFKPASSITKQQKTLTIDKEEAIFQLPHGSRHDPCVAIRAVPVVEAMVALVLCDALLYNKCVRL